MLLQNLLLTSYISLAFAAPYQTREEKEAELEARQLTYSTPGINFDYVTKVCAF